MTLQGAHVIITGASAGIGHATAKALAKKGAKLTLFARRQTPLDALQAEIKASGGEALVMVGDVTLPGDRQRLLEEARAQFGPVDVLINNAGRADQGLTSALDSDTLRGMMALNFEAPLALAQGLLPEMRERDQGVIVNLLTHAVFHGFALTPGYVAAKSALHGATMNLRYELVDTQVRVLGVYPGLVDTEFSRSMVPEGSSTADLMLYMRHFRAGQRASAEFKRIERPMKAEVVAEAIAAGLEDDTCEHIFPDDHHRSSAGKMWEDTRWWSAESKAFYGAFLPPLRALMVRLMTLAKAARDT